MKARDRKKRREAPLRTKEYVTHEQLGLALGRWAMRSPTFYSAILAGFGLAVRESHGQRELTSAEILEDLRRVETAIARVHNVNITQRKKRKSR